MNRFILSVITAVILMLFACGQMDENKSAMKNSGENTREGNMEYMDWHSQSNAAEIHPKHLSLDIGVDFKKHQITGSARWEIQPDAGVEYAIFDTWDLKIDSVFYGDGTPAAYELGEKVPYLGRALKIALQPGVKNISIYYKTGENALALQWLTPSQTFGKEHPYLFTQGETIYSRSWFPCPDGPGYRFTYDADISVPVGLMALMSAENPQEISENGKYRFTMKQKIPAYLVALAVGDIQFKSVDQRTGVYAEPAIFAEAYKELEDIGQMVTTAEEIYGEYRWGRYDVLILPSGFPIGGMENPRLTFATPTILAGDKSLTNLIAHELAHSWSGNLVTNATWDDFWLNEGFTVYFEHRIMEALYGKEYVAMLWDLSKRVLEKSVESLGENSRHTWLKEDLKGKDPDDGFTDIPYEKGAAFLLKIEQTVGRENWDAFVMKYFNDHAFQSMTTERFIEYLNVNLLDGHEDWKTAIDMKTWIYGPGIPRNFPTITSQRFEKVDAEVLAYTQGAAPENLMTKGWSTFEWLRFLDKLPEKLSQTEMENLDAAFHFTDTRNSEIADEWFLIALRNDYTVAYPAMKEFLYVTGRMKFLEPLYEEMMKTDSGQNMAHEIYEIARPNYHPLTQKSIESILEKK